MLEELTMMRGYVPNAVHFNGTNTWLSKASEFAGSANSKQLTVSYWIRCLDGDGINKFIFYKFRTGVTWDVQMRRTSDNRLRIFAQNGATLILGIQSSVNSVVAGKWYHFLCSVDVSDTAKRHLYIDDVSDINVDTYANADIDFTNTSITFGTANTADLSPFSIADFWYQQGLYIDFSIEANRRKFRTASGRPQFLGIDGSIPTGSAPILFLSGATSDWHTNKGGGGGFTENGALVDAASRP